MPSYKNRRLEQRREEAAIRQAESDHLSLEQKIKRSEDSAFNRTKELIKLKAKQKLREKKVLEQLDQNLENSGKIIKPTPEKKKNYKGKKRKAQQQKDQ